MVNVIDLLQYNVEIRHRYFETLANLPWGELVKNREASFESLRNIFIHSIGVTDYWLDFLLKEHLRTQGRYEQYTNVKQIRDFMEHVEVRMKFLETLKRNTSERQIQVSPLKLLLRMF